MPVRGEFHPSAETLPNLRGHGRGRLPSRDVAGFSDIGGRPRNEDQLLVADVERRVRVRASSVPTEDTPHELAASEGTIAAVADGMGGHGSGDLAAAVTIDGVLDFVVNEMPWHASVNDEHRRELVEGFGGSAHLIQERLWEVAAREHASPRLGTTLTIAYLLPRELFVAHVGDSRCYVLRGRTLTQLTEDHTLAREAEREELGLDLSHLSHILVNVIGGNRREPRIDGLWVELHPGDRVMLCSDGLTDAIDDRTVQAELSRGDDAAAVCRRLVRAAVQAGATDNVTAVVALA